MRPYSNLDVKQLLVPPFRRETNVPEKDIPIYSKMTPVIPPFLPYRHVGKFAKFPGILQQVNILKYGEEEK